MIFLIFLPSRSSTIYKSVQFTCSDYKPPCSTESLRYFPNIPMKGYRMIEGQLKVKGKLGQQNRCQPPTLTESLEEDFEFGPQLLAAKAKMETMNYIILLYPYNKIK